MTTDVLFRQAGPADLPALVALSQSMNWPHRLVDWSMLLDLGAGWVATHHGQTIGSVLYWHQGERHATIGLVIVAHAWQGRRIGFALMQHALASCPGRVVMLHATQEGAPLYRRLGFEPAHMVRQHQRAHFSAPDPWPEAASDAVHHASPGRLRAMTPSDHDSVIALYSQAAGMDKRHILAPFLPDSQGKVLMRSHTLAGFSLLRPYGRGQHIGPIVAPDVDAARHLAACWMHSGTPMFLRVDASDDALSAWLHAAGLPQVDPVQCMWRPVDGQHDPEARPDDGHALAAGPGPGDQASGTQAGVKVFAVLNQALG